MEESQTIPSQKTGKKAHIHKPFFLLTIAVVIGLFGAGVYKYMQSGSVLGETQNLDEKTIIKKVRSHIILPGAETPKVIPITNVEELQKTQPFFHQARNGDQLLIFSTKVILYNPRADRIVDIAQIGTVSDSIQNPK